MQMGIKGGYTGPMLREAFFISFNSMKEILDYGIWYCTVNRDNGQPPLPSLQDRNSGDQKQQQQQDGGEGQLRPKP